MDFVEICNICARKAIIKVAKRKMNSDEIRRSYSDLNFGVTFLEHSVVTKKLATSPDHLDMSRWSESRQPPRNFLVTSWRLPHNICYGEVTGKLVPVEFELIQGCLQ